MKVSYFLVRLRRLRFVINQLIKSKCLTGAQTPLAYLVVSTEPSCLNGQLLIVLTVVCFLNPSHTLLVFMGGGGG